MEQQKQSLTLHQILEKIRELQEKHLNLESSLISSALNLDKLTIMPDVNFSQSKFESLVEFKGMKFEKMVDFKGSVFEGPVIFRKTSFKDILDLRSCVFKEQVIFEDIESSGKILFNNSSFLKPVEIKRGNFKEEVYFNETNFEDKFVITLSWFSNLASFFDISLAKGIEINGAEFNKSFDLGCSDETKLDKILNKFSCISSSFLGEASFRGRKFLGLTVFKNINFDITPLFANCVFAQDITLSNIKFCDVESEIAEKHYRILKDVLEECGDDIKASFFEKLENKTRRNIIASRTRTSLASFIYKACEFTKAKIIASQNHIAEILYLLRKREYELITRKIFKTNYRRLYNYRSLKNLVQYYLKKPKEIRSNKLHILQ
jgi:hypothetical protein